MNQYDIHNDRDYRMALMQMRRMVTGSGINNCKGILQLLIDDVEHYESRVLGIEASDKVLSLCIRLKRLGLTEEQIQSLCEQKSTDEEALNV